MESQQAHIEGIERFNALKEEAVLAELNADAPATDTELDVDVDADIEVSEIILEDSEEV
jgi:hypothetical protein